MEQALAGSAVFCYNTAEVICVPVRLTVITSRYLLASTQAAMERVGANCQFRVVTYDDFTHIAQVYERWEPESDGFLVSGPTAAAAIRLAHPNGEKPVLSFQEDAAALYKALLKLVLEDREQDIGRIVLDFLLPLNCGYTLRDFLSMGEIEFVERGNMERLRVENGADDIETYIAGRLIELWERGEMDVAVCQYSSIVPVLEERGIPCRYPFISDDQLAGRVNEALVQIELERLRASLPASIHIVRPGPAGPDGMVEMERALTQYLADNFLSCQVRQYQGGLQAFTTLQAVRCLMRGGTACPVSAYLREKLGFPVAVGYGVGSTESHAAANAQLAACEAAFSGESFLVDEAGNLIGPLGAPRQIALESEQDVDLLAQQCGLSPVTIRRLLASIRISETNRVTAQELANRFGVTVRNANRILSRLTSGGLARVAYIQSNSARGRPVKVYELQIHT